jgi:hypothetical protein
MPPAPSDSEIRINARLVGEDARRFRELQRRHGLSASDLLREALREYHHTHAKSRANAAKILQASGFIGGGAGPADLSTRYKTYLTDAVEKKVPLMVHEPDPEDPYLRKRAPNGPRR